MRIRSVRISVIRGDTGEACGIRREGLGSASGLGCAKIGQVKRVAFRMSQWDVLACSYLDANVKVTVTVKIEVRFRVQVRVRISVCSYLDANARNNNDCDHDHKHNYNSCN